MRTPPPARLVWTLALLALAAAPAAADPPLPRFTEAREAAALFFVRKHTPDLLPLFDQLKKNNPAQYQQEVREVFHVTELLADIQDEPRRHDLELEIWKTEARANAVAARLGMANEDERKKAEGDLLRLARDLIDLDIQVLELKAEQAEKDLGDAREELARAREQVQTQTRDRFDRLVNQAQKRRK